MYQPYATAAYYLNEFKGKEIPGDQLERRLRDASRHIDALTFNRILLKGFDRLSEFRKDLIREVVCKQAEFEYQNEDLLESMLSSYSINGVTMQYKDSETLIIQSGVVMKRNLYSLLEQTGLTCRRMGVWR